MNKHLIILLAAFVAVHAFVKRETPTTESNYLAEAQAKLQALGDQINNQLKETFDAEKMKTEFNKVVDTISNALKQENKDKQ